MANVRVAVRVRPLSKRETKEGGKIIVEVDDKVTKIRNLKVNSRPDHFGDSREKVVAFNFDYCYWSVNPEDPQYASQDVVFQDLGTEVLSGATKGYNICLFAYGQTGSGKTYTMLGTPASVGLTPRICEGLFSRKEAQALLPSSCRIKVSFLEIYNERVRDLLKQSDPKKSYTLRVREHPEMGPYVQGLSQHVVTNYKQVIRLLEEGIANRITAATHVHEASSRSHAIFTIHYSQATLQNNLPSEITSKINLVDLAGSEKADPSYCKNRMAEGANINKSLVALGIVISTLAQNSQMVSSCQSLHSTAGSDESGTPGFLPGPSSGGGPSRRQPYIPYRDSVLTWLLKDSLGGNSRTIMVATVSPAHTSYSETLSTLRYASNAKNIVNRPEVNEDANVKLIRELREEIGRLKALLLSCELRNFCWSRVGEDAGLKGLVLQNELKIDELIRDWTQKWRTWQALLEHCSVDVSKSRSGVAISSSLPHLMALEDDVLNTGVVLYHLKEGITKIGRSDSDQEQDIVLQGQWIERDHCTITSACGVVVLRPVQGARCTVNGRKVTASCRLTQGAVVTLGKAQRFRFNHPAEAAVLRQRRQVGEAFGNSSSLEWLDLDGNVAASFLGVGPLLWKERQVPQEQCDEDHPAPGDTEVGPRAQGQHQQCRWGALRQQIPAGHSRAEEELEFGQTCTSQQTEEGYYFPSEEKASPEEWPLSLQPGMALHSWRIPGPLGSRVRDVSQKYSCLPRGRSLKRQYSSGDPDTTASCVEPSSVVGSAREKGSDTSDTDSNYSVDSLSSVCAEASLRKPPIPQDPPGVWGLPESGVSDSDNSQISEDSLAEKGYQSPKESLKALRPPSDHGHPRTRMRTSGRGVSMPSGRHMLSGAHRSLSSNHLTGAEEELGKEEPFLGSMDEMPAETFWHLQTPVLPIRPRPIIHGAGARLSAIPPVSSSPYLDPQLQPVSEWPESETEPSCPKGGLQLSRESPLVSTDSWFSCDSKVSPCSPSGIEGLSRPSPRVQEIQPCSQERAGNWPAVKDLKPSGMEAGLLCSLALPQDCAELSCNADVHTASVSDTSRLSLWGTARLLQPVADGNAQSRGSCNPTQQGSFGLSNSSESGVPIASVASFTYVDSTHERDWAALQRKYPCELSHSVLEDVGEPGPGFFFLGEDSSPLARDSSGGDTHLPDGHGVSRILDVSHTLVQLSKARCLRAEREQDSVNAKLENTKLVFSSSGREASCSGFSSADLASLASGSRSTQDCVIESKMANSVKAAHEVEQMSGEEGSGGPGVASSAQQAFQKSACHSRATSPTQADHRPQGWSPLRKNSVAQPEQLIPKSHPPQQEGRAGFQESSGETGVRNAGISFAFPSGPAVYLHSASWSPSPPPLQPPPLETVYVTKSRDALTETALEVPTCREVWVPSPPPREAWGLDHSHQDLPEASLKNSWPVPLQSQESQVASPQPVTAGKPVGLTGRDGPGHLQECSVSTQEESHDVLCFLSAQDRHFLSSNSTKIYEFESQVRILNNKHSFSALQQREKAAIGPCCSVSVDGSVCGKPCLFVCESEAEEKEGQAHTQACARGRQCPSRTRPDCICEATDGSLKRDMAEGNAASVMPRCGCDRVGSPTIKMQDKSLTYAWEGKTEARLLGEPPHLRDSPTRLTLSGTELTSGKVQLVTGCQERSPSECQGPRVPQDMFNSGEEIWGKKQNKRVNNADEMARLVKSVMQLENDILEIESKQNKWLHASPPPGDQKDQERADHVLRPGSPGNCLAFKDLPYSLGQTNDRLFQDSESGEKEADSITGKGLQAQKITSSPFRPGEHVEEKEDKDQDGETGLTVESRAEDQGAPCNASSPSVSPLREPELEPQLLATSAHASICLAILEEIRDGDLEKRNSKATPHSVHLPFTVPSRACEMGQTGETMDSHMSLACGRESRGIGLECGPVDSSPPEPSAAAALLSPAPAGGCLSSLCDRTYSLAPSAAGGSSEIVGRPEEIEAASFPSAMHAKPLKSVKGHSLDSAWEVDGQQRDQAPGGGKDSAPGGDPLPAGERVLNACQPGDAGREVAVTKPPRSRTSSPGFEDASSVPLAESTARRTGQPCHEGCQWDPYHRCSLPVTGIFSGPRHSLSSLRPQMVSSSPSRQELNTRVEAPPPTDEDTKGLSRPWSPSVWGCSSGKQAAAPRRDEDCREKALSSPGDGSVGPRLLAPPLPPDCTFSTLWCIPTPDVKISWESGTSAQAQQDKPPNLGIQVRPENGQVDKEVWYFDPSDNRPCIPPWCPEGPVHMGWRQCVFGGAADASCSQKAGGLMPSDVVQCSRMGDGLGDQDSPVHSHLTMSAQPRDLSGTQSSFKSGQGTPGAWKMWSSSFVSGDLHILKAQASASEASCPEGRARMTQGTQTIGCRRHWSCADVPSTQHDIVVMSPCDLASWTSMHSLSTHLSQLLHSTSELLESLSQPGVAKRDFLAEAPLALRTDGATQTTVDKGSQTELALSPLPLQDPEATPLEVAVVPEVLSTDLLATSQEKRDIAGTLQESQAKEPACKAADLREDSVQDPLMPSSRWRLQKAAWGQALSPASPPPSPSLLPTSAQPEESCMGVSPSFSLPPPLGLFPGASEPHLEPRGQRKLDHTSALLVDRASSPILTLSASTQAVGPPSTPFPKGHLKLDASPRPLPADELGSLPGAEAVGEEGQSASEGSQRKLSELSPPWSSQQSPQLQVSFLEQLQPEATTGDRSSSPPPPPKHRSQGTADSIVPEEEASPECGPLDSTGPSQWQSVPGSGGKGPASPVEPKPTLDPASLWTCSPQLIDTAGLQGSTVGPPQACQPQGVLCPPSLGCMASRPQLHSLRDLPIHNKFRNWCGVLDASPGGLAVNEEHRASLDLSSGEQPQRPPQPSVHGLDPAWYLRKQIPLQVGAPNPSLSVELTEAKLYRGFGEADALLQVLQNGTGEALAPDSPVMSTWEELYSRQKKAIETLRRERAERLQNSCWTGSLSPQKQLSLQPTREPPFCNLDLPSKRLEYLQCLRKEVVETTRSPRAAWSSIHPSPDPELMLRDCQRAREEAKVEMARARDLLQERTGREKLQIRRQIAARLWQEEEKLHTLACHSSPCTSSHGSLSSGVTSGYNSSPALSGQLHSPESGGASSLPDSQDAWTGYRWSYSALRDNHLGVARATGKNSTNGCSLGSGCRAPSSPSPLGACFSSCYQDLAKHIVDTSVADVMAACSDNLHNLFCCQATAGWNYQGEEQQVQLYYKEFSSTRHGFLGAGVVPQPLSHVWAAVSDPTLWPLYHKPIQTARLQQRVTNSISLVYLVCDPTLCALKQPRDFCCVCVEAKEAPALPGGHLSVMAAQSVYDTSMPRPSRRMVRGEVLPSAWVLQPVTVEGREVTRVIYLAQVELGAPGFPPHLLSSFLRQQPLTVARLSSFLGS
ncbi:stAR-related lipid transfer protein 9 [Ctenodactylus gundi]